ncbi:MAG: glycosyltransferase family 2 protein [Rikenellaceae bacterium]
MLVSILVPLYNVERYVEQCARSLFEQSYQRCEYIFVDDCSTDCSAAIIDSLVAKEYAELEGRVKIVRHSRNMGVNTSRAMALSHANGDYVIFVDGDDFVDRQMVTTLVGSCGNGTLDIVSSGYVNYSSESHCEFKHSRWIGDASHSMQVVLTQSFAISNHIWGKLFKRELFAGETILFDPTLHLGEDMVLLVQLLNRADRIGYVDEYLYYYRQNVSGSLTQNLNHGARFNYLRSIVTANKLVGVEINNSKIFALQRLNIKRWLLKRSTQRNHPLTYLFRVYCYLANRFFL